MHKDKIAQWLEQPDHYRIKRDDADYPALLRETAGAPEELYVQGDPAALSRPAIAIVGSRNSTPYGREMAFRLSAELARKGFVVSSGLATGIDTEAHKACLKVGGPTVAVLGNGLLDIYPPANAGLAATIAAASERVGSSHTQGALVSELPLDAPPLPSHFPSRNRIISGMSLGVCVIEATIRSGSLITARLALEQNREVFAVPGSANSSRSRGCHQLLRQGAVLVETADDILAHVESLYHGQLDLLASQQGGEPIIKLNNSADMTDSLAADEVVDPVYSCIGNDPVTLDALILRTGLGISSLSQQLLSLELAGKIEKHGGGWMRSSATFNKGRP